MKERPIPFNADMVRAVLDGRKTQTRRILKPQPVEHDGYWSWSSGYMGKDDRHPLFGLHFADASLPQCRRMLSSVPSPYGKPGDRLWVRETLRIIERGTRGVAGDHLLKYEATHVPVQIADTAEKRAWVDARLVSHIERAHDPLGNASFRVPSIHMPRWASRILLEVTDVRVERVQEISIFDVIEEGVSLPNYATQPEMRCAFRDLWKSINGPDAWGRNDWVWVVEFKRVDGVLS